ncbi:MAG TPA: sugar transferase [Caulobacteraceae bacterium]|nr:sugar transferase [Caulobacteraceae bacterium]
MARDVASEFFVQIDTALDLGAERLRRARLKRLMDVVGAIGLLILFAPLMVLVALAIRLETAGPALFRQRRTGCDGMPFMIYKFRTMRVVEDGPNVVQALRDDCRITRVGRFLRRTSVDELPNLFNVLKGDMSLVGPRPHALAHDRYYAAAVPSYVLRFRTRPGITGLAQVTGLRGGTAEVSAMAERVAKDVEYIRDWSLLLDVQILVRTFGVFAFHPAAY